MRKLPQSPFALRLALQAAYASGGSKEAARIATAHLDGFKNNTAALRAAAVVALSFGDAERATAIEEQIVDSGRAQAGDYNELVWATLIAGKVTPKTLELANRAMMVSNNGSAPIMHTLAAVEAELDKPSEARATLLQRISALGEDEPDDNDWYVFGRIAESYGLKQEAATMYRRLERPKDEQSVPSSSYALAEAASSRWIWPNDRSGRSTVRRPASSEPYAFRYGSAEVIGCVSCWCERRRTARSATSIKT